jgi:rhodanese-related sulfurtransferase
MAFFDEERSSPIAMFWSGDWTRSGRIEFCDASDPDRPVIVVCDEGYAASLAAARLLDLGHNVTISWRDTTRGN